MPLPPLKAVEGHPGIATDPKGRYWIRIKLGKKRVTELRASFDDAVATRDALKVDYRRRRAVPGHRDYVKPGKCRLKDYIRRIEDRISISLKPATLSRYRVSQRAILRLFGEAITLEQITPEAVSDFRIRRRREVEPATVNRDLTRLNTILKEAVREGFLYRVPFEFKREKFREPEGRIRVMDAEEEERILDAASPSLEVMIKFALLTGFRLNEQLKLRWRQVHKTRIQLHGSQTKTHRRRMVPLTDKIRELLEFQRGVHKEWVFPNRGLSNHWERQNFYRDEWNPCRDVAGVVDLKWHDLRHTFCSRLVAAGANIVAVKELAGHRSIEVTMKYVHLSPEHLVNTMNLL